MALGPVSLAITPRQSRNPEGARLFRPHVARIELTLWTRIPDGSPVSLTPPTILTHPMKGPFRTQRVTAMTALEAQAIALCKSAHSFCRRRVIVTPEDATQRWHPQMHLLTVVELDGFDHIAIELSLAPVVHARLPLSVSEAGRLHIFRPDDGGEEHYAVEIGRPSRDAPVLARLHSACFTGDVLGSLKCDCGPQLHAALARMGEEGAGVLLYLNQEGRGIGLGEQDARLFPARSRV